MQSNNLAEKERLLHTRREKKHVENVLISKLSSTTITDGVGRSKGNKKLEAIHHALTDKY